MAVSKIGKSQDGCYKKTKHAKLSKKRRGVKKCSFYGKFVALCFLVTPILRFALLPNYRRSYVHVISFMKLKNWYFLWGSGDLIFQFSNVSIGASNDGSLDFNYSTCGK